MLVNRDMQMRRLVIASRRPLKKFARYDDGAVVGRAHNFGPDVYYYVFNTHNYRFRVAIMAALLRRPAENNWAVDVIVFGRKRSGNVAIKIVITSNDGPPLFADVHLISPI